jgi:RNA polymerase sigma-70 factor, ECF subfamily
MLHFAVRDARAWEGFMSARPNPLSETDEAELVRSAQARDQEAFQELMRRTTTASMRLALSVVKNREDAEDQVQTSFLNAWKRIGSFHLEAKFSTWMRTIVMNQSLMHLRSKRRASLQPLDDGREDGSVMHPVDTRPGQEMTLGQRQLTDHLGEELRRLPPIFREVLNLRDLQELSTEEVAARLGISEPAVKSRLSRARQLLRQRMERHAGLTSASAV